MLLPLKGLSEQLAQPKAKQVPDWILEKATSLQTKLSEISDNAEAVLQDPRQTLLYTNPKDLSDVVTSSKRHEALVKQMIASLRIL